MKYLIVGLGNPGAKYENTRHNIGFKVLDTLNELSNTSFKEEKHAYYSSVKHKARTYHLIKPTTFMNLSGKAVNYWMQSLKISAENILVVTDDIALPFGIELGDSANLPMPQGIPKYDASDKPCFIGHYWLSGDPEPLAANIACLDYSVAKNGKLVAYRWSGESRLTRSNFAFRTE